MKVRLELCYQGQIDLVVTIAAHVLNDSQYANPGAWQPNVGPGQPDLEGHLITRRLRVSRLQPLANTPCLHPCRTYTTVLSLYARPVNRPSMESATRHLHRQSGFDLTVELPPLSRAQPAMHSMQA